VFVKVDIVKNPGGEALSNRYGLQGGLPAWTILDASQQVVADSMKDKKNVGFPYEPEEVAHYLDALKKSCPKLTAEDFRVFKEQLDEHCRLIRAELEAKKNAKKP
jgi:hypothetical protein